MRYTGEGLFEKITVIQGDPGDGKTTCVLAISASVTTGKPLLGTKETTEPINVIFQTAEDGLGDTIKPRLLQAGADCSLVHVIAENNIFYRQLCTQTKRI